MGETRKSVVMFGFSNTPNREKFPPEKYPLYHKRIRRDRRNLAGIIVGGALATIFLLYHIGPAALAR